MNHCLSQSQYWKLCAFFSYAWISSCFFVDASWLQSTCLISWLIWLWLKKLTFWQSCRQQKNNCSSECDECCCIKNICIIFSEENSCHWSLMTFNNDILHHADINVSNFVLLYINLFIKQFLWSSAVFSSFEVLITFYL